MIHAGTPTTLAELISGAIKVLDEFGWTQGKLGDSTCGVCLMGAVNAAAHGEANPHNEEESFVTPATSVLAQEFEAARIIKPRYNSAWGSDHYVDEHGKVLSNTAVNSLWAWNDREERTEAEVRYVLEVIAATRGDIEIDLSWDKVA